MTNYLNLPGTDETLSIDYKTLLGKRVQAGGKKYIYARAGAALTAKTPYGLIHEGGTTGTDPVVKALLNTAVKQLVCIPMRTLADDDCDWFQYQGTVTSMVVASATYTATYALKVDAGVVTQISAAPTNADNEFASVQVGGTTVTAINAFLFGREVLTET